MRLHRDAKTTPAMRRLIVQRVRAEHWPVRQVATAAVVSGPGRRDLVVASYRPDGGFRWRGGAVSPSAGTFLGDWVDLPRSSACQWFLDHTTALGVVPDAVVEGAGSCQRNSLRRSAGAIGSQAAAGEAYRRATMRG